MFILYILELLLGAPVHLIIIGFIRLSHVTHASLAAQVHAAKDDVINKRYQRNLLFWDAEDVGVKHCVLTGVAGGHGQRVAGVDSKGTLPFAPIRVHLFLKGTTSHGAGDISVRDLHFACA
jgi:hypothetical protein